MSNSLSLQHPINGRVAIIAGLRTPFARQATAFSELSALELGKMLIAQFIRQLPFEAKLIEQLVFGQVVQMPQAPNIAREIVLGTAMPIATDAYTVTRACATSFQALANVATSITSGEIEIGIAGGADSSSLLPIGLSRKFATTLLALSKEKTLGGKFKRLRQLGLKDLLPVPPAIAEYSTGLSMGQTAEQMAKTFAISRDEQDRFAYRSHQLAAKAWQQGKLDNLVMTAFARPYKQWLKKDNCIRDKVVFEAYGKLHPVFDKMHGSVSAANSSPLTDGAAAILLMSEKKAKALNLKPLGFVKSFAFSANQVDENMLLGPAFSIPLALDKAGIGLADCSFVEMHEAFSAQVLANVKMLSCDKFAKTKLNRAKAVGEIDIDKLNPLGGSIAYGHPFAATGARMVMQSLDELRRKKQQFVLNAACASGGLGAAMVLEANYD